MPKILLAVVMFQLSLLSLAQKKLALVVTIDKYPMSNGWRPTFASNDLSYMIKVLQTQRFDRIDTIKEANATRKGILNGLDKLAARAEKGNIVLFHFAGHGQQVFDIADPSRGLALDEEDGYDEALVAYDALSKYGMLGYKGENHIRDEELGAKLNLIRKKIGETGSLLVLIDACYSGTVTRGDEAEQGIYRGIKDRIEPKYYKRKLTAGEDGFLQDRNSDELLSKMVLISASSQDQKNYTRSVGGAPVGALSYAFSKAIGKISEPVDYKTLFEWIRNEIETNRQGQNPMMEGPDSLMVFGTNIIPGENFVTATPERNNKSQVILNRGILYDLFTGMEFFLYPLNVFQYDSIKAIAKGRIIAADPFIAKGVLQVQLPGTEVYKAVFMQKAMGDFTCRIKLKLGPGLKPVVEEKLVKYRNLVLDNNNPDVSVSQQPRSLVAVRSHSTGRYDTLWSMNYGRETDIKPADLDQMIAKINQFARAKYLRSMSLPPGDSSFSDVDIEIIPVKAEVRYEQCISGENVRRRIANHKEFTTMNLADITTRKEGIAIKARPAAGEFTGIRIKVINRSEKPVFLSVLDIQPDDTIRITVPYESCDPNGNYVARDPNNFKIAAEDSLVTKIIGFTPPYGQEYLKILVTDKPLNFSGFPGIVQKGDGNKTGFDDFLSAVITEEGFENSYRKKGEPAVPVVPVRTGSMKIVPFIFYIVK